MGDLSLKTESYCDAVKSWPKTGRHILAHFDEDTVVVYQAYKPPIALYAVEHQRFGGPDFSFSRMSWIKPNFLWMMYRSGWATKPSQEHILAVHVKREGFEEILANAYTVWHQKQEGLTSDEIQIRLQWDPDHSPTGEKEERKAIQLGLKGDMLEKYSSEWIVKIEDITKFVQEQHTILQQDDGLEQLRVIKERVYSVHNENITKQINLDIFESG